VIEHEEARLHLADLVVPTLADPMRVAGVKSHVAVCSECRAELDDLKQLDATIHGTGPAPTPPPELTARVLAVTGSRPTDHDRGPVARRLWRDVTVWRLGTALAVLAATILAALLVTAGSDATRFHATVTRTFAPGPNYLAVGTVACGRLGGHDAIRLHVSGLPSLPSGYYELWMAKSVDERLSLGQYEPAADGTLDITIPVPGGDDEYRGVWLTHEPMDNDPAWSSDWVVKASCGSPVT
jgi:anti-sigma-K factor RskA